MSKEVTLLIDGDVIAFIAAAAAQQNSEDEFGFITPFANRHVGEALVDNMIIGLEQAFNSSHFRVALTDPKENWRKGVYENYKGNRKDSVRPLLLTVLKDYLTSKYGAFFWPGLEADDVLGILNTEPQAYEGRRILVGKDKDFLTVPGDYHKLGDYVGSKPVVKTVTPWEAQRFHLFQTLTGDAVDGYPGCPGIGKTRAEALLESPVRLVPGEGVITRGVNKGNSVTRWVSEPTRDLWAMVVSHYRKGYQGTDVDGETEALRTARLAYILHHEDYNRETEEITLWTPDRLRQS